MTIRVEQIETRTAPEAVLATMHDLYVLAEQEELPGDPPTPLERHVLEWRHRPDSEDAPRWLLWDDDELIGMAIVWVDLEQNLENGFARAWIRPDRRGEGHFRELAGPILDYLDAHGRTRVDTYVLQGAPETALCERLGLKSVYKEKRSRLVMAEVDRHLMQSWVDRAPERASEYHLLTLRTPFPEDVVAPYAELQFQMNTAPMEDFEFEDEVITPERWLEREQWLADNKRDLYAMVAVHTETGAYAGSTSISYDPLHPSQAWQWETVVHPDHRNKGLGRWLKGANILRILDERPDVERVDTWNAGSNEPMLNINVAMGFAPILFPEAWQGPTAGVRASLFG
jgi:GNAT superfamily N-acetyltransferase